MFQDLYVDKEDNAAILNIVLTWLTSDAIKARPGETRWHCVVRGGRGLWEEIGPASSVSSSPSHSPFSRFPSSLPCVGPHALLHASQLNTIDAEDPEIADYHHLPNVAQLSEQLRVCLQVPPSLSRRPFVISPSSISDHSPRFPPPSSLLGSPL